MRDHRSYVHNLDSCENIAWKKSLLEWDKNPSYLYYQCSAQPAELSDQLVILWVWKNLKMVKNRSEYLKDHRFER